MAGKDHRVLLHFTRTASLIYVVNVQTDATSLVLFLSDLMEILIQQQSKEGTAMCKENFSQFLCYEQLTNPEGIFRDMWSLSQQGYP